MIPTVDARLRLIDRRMITWSRPVDCQSLMYVWMIVDQLVWTLVRDALKHMMPLSWIASSTILMLVFSFWGVNGLTSIWSNRRQIRCTCNWIVEKILRAKMPCQNSTLSSGIECGWGSWIPRCCTSSNFNRVWCWFSLVPIPASIVGGLVVLISHNSKNKPKVKSLKTFHC